MRRFLTLAIILVLLTPAFLVAAKAQTSDLYSPPTHLQAYPPPLTMTPTPGSRCVHLPLLLKRVAPLPKTRVLVAPETQSIVVGRSATVRIEVQDVTGLYGAEVHVTFDSRYLQALDGDGNPANGIQVAAGDIFTGKNVFTPLNSINNTTGRISYGISLMAEPSGVTGSGSLFNVTLQGTTPGHSSIALVTVLLASRTGGAIAAQSVDGSVTVTR